VRQLGKFGYLILGAKKKKTPEEAREALRLAGILTETGELTEQFKGKITMKKKRPAKTK